VERAQTVAAVMDASLQTLLWHSIPHSFLPR
jgi:hypothetical protein